VRKNGKAAFEELLVKADPLSRFLIDELRRNVDINAPEGRAKLLQQAKPLVKQIAAPMFSLMIRKELAQVTGVLTARQDLVDRTVIRAPLRGTVKNVRVTTIGGVIQPGQDIMEIVPLEDQLLVEARIPPSEVAFLRPGLAAKVKLTAYDYTSYGGLDGRVEFISADTLRDERKPGEENYYRVLVRTDKSVLVAGGKSLPIIPGMTATVEIRTGEKSVLDYLLKPVLRSREALRER
jgi:adhesin transport system membrane fusion protein